jgi:hypothetical protein
MARRCSGLIAAKPRRLLPRLRLFPCLRVVGITTLWLCVLEHFSMLGKQLAGGVPIVFTANCARNFLNAIFFNAYCTIQKIFLHNADVSAARNTISPLAKF